MIAAWMARAILTAALVAVAAVALDRTLRLWQRQTRLVWIVAIVISIIVPALGLVQLLGWLPRSSGLSALAAPLGAVAVVLPAVVIGSAPPMFDALFALGWMAASLLLAVRFVRSARVLALRRRDWRFTEVDGQSLLVSDNAGPAVIGFREPVVVVPDWVLGLDASLRALVLRHEREHVDGGDPRLLLGAVVAAVLFPWNLALWFQVFRLRSAMELDCDARVLRAFPDARRYGSLLLAVAQRGDRAGLLVPALNHPNSLLARRIFAMRRVAPKYRVPRSVSLTAVAALLVAVACEVQTAPDVPKPEGVVQAKIERARPTTVPADQPYFEFQVEDPVTRAASSPSPRFPDVLRRRGIGGEVLAQFVVGADGRADLSTFHVLKSTDDRFTDAVRNALPEMQFNPALVGGKAVRQLVQTPFTFSLNK